MDTVRDTIIKRRSIRRYTDAPIPADDVAILMQAALMAPTSKNQRSCEFAVVDNPLTIGLLKECKPSGAVAMSTAPLCIVIYCDPEKTACLVEDTSIAASYIQLQAAAIGLGTCWIQVRGRFTADGESSEDVVKETLGLAPQMIVECIITIGYPAEERKPNNLEALTWERVHIYPKA